MKCECVVQIQCTAVLTTEDLETLETMFKLTNNNETNPRIVLINFRHFQTNTDIARTSLSTSKLTIVFVFDDTEVLCAIDTRRDKTMLQLLSGRLITEEKVQSVIDYISSRNQTLHWYKVKERYWTLKRKLYRIPNLSEMKRDLNKSNTFLHDNDGAREMKYIFTKYPSVSLRVSDTGNVVVTSKNSERTGRGECEECLTEFESVTGVRKELTNLEQLQANGVPINCRHVPSNRQPVLYIEGATAVYKDRNIFEITTTVDGEQRKVKLVSPTKEFPFVRLNERGSVSCFKRKRAIDENNTDEEERKKGNKNIKNNYKVKSGKLLEPGRVGVTKNGSFVSNWY